MCSVIPRGPCIFVNCFNSSEHQIWNLFSLLDVLVIFEFIKHSCASLHGFILLYQGRSIFKAPENLIWGLLQIVLVHYCFYITRLLRVLSQEISFIVAGIQRFQLSSNTMIYFLTLSLVLLIISKIRELPPILLIFPSVKLFCAQVKLLALVSVPKLIEINMLSLISVHHATFVWHIFFFLYLIQLLKPSPTPKDVQRLNVEAKVEKCGISPSAQPVGGIQTPHQL